MFAQIPYVRGAESSWIGGKPPHEFAPDGSWISTIDGFNADGSFVAGRNPVNGLYAPGDSYIGNRPVYYNENGLYGKGGRPYMDPDGVTGPRVNFEHGFGGPVAAGVPDSSGNGTSVYVAPPVAQPVSTPKAVFTAPITFPPVTIGDNGSRPATFSAADVAEVHKTGTLATAFALRGVDTTPMTPPVLNVNRILTNTDTTSTVGPAKTTNGNGPQILPTNATVAKRVNYLPWLLVLLVLIVIATHKKK